ncbi:hypothetical protein WJX84_009505 [Apatococcus fuscideae]|uniref:MYND-type domain-containing protein n=1 Tax=Apatococcus fuscideae TaxID=2026836 RepID=A0AAW1TB94_9CHLO
MAHGPWFAVFCRKGGVSCRLSGAEAGQKPCVTCGFRSPKSHCSLCKQVRYCGRNCQAADWKSHRIYCHSLAGQEYHQCFQPQVEHNSADRNKALTALFSAAELGKMCGDWMLESHALEDLTVLRKPYEKIGFPATATVRFLQRSSEHKDNIALGCALSYHGRMNCQAGKHQVYTEACIANAYEIQPGGESRAKAAEARGRLGTLMAEAGKALSKTCSICLEELHPEQPSPATQLVGVVIPCMHCYHLAWLDMNGNAVVSRAFTSYLTLGGKQRASLWKTELPEAAKEDGFYEANSASLCQLIFQTLFEYIDLSSQRAVLDFIRQAVSNEFFLKTFAGAICRVDPSSYGRKESFAVLCWSSAVLRKLQPAGAQKAIDKLVQCQAACLETLWRSYSARGQKSWRPIQRVIDKSIGSCLWLAEQYLTACSTSGSEGLARALLRAHATAPGLSDPQDQLLKAYCGKVLGSKEVVATHVHQAFQPLLAQLSAEQFGTSLLPVLLRMLKRSPEVTLPSLTSVCSEVQIDLSQHGPDLLAVLLPPLRSSKDNLRQLATSALQALAGRLEQQQALEAACTKLLGILSGKAEGKLKSAYERVGLAGGLQAMAAGASASQELAQLADPTSETLCGLYKEQPNEETRLAVLAAAAAWLQMASKVSPAAVGLLASGLQEPARKNHLQALIQVLRSSSGTNAQWAGLAEALLVQPSQQHRQAVPGQQTNALQAQLCRLLMTAALHHSKAVQAAACQAAQRSIKAVPSSAEPFAAAILARLEDWTELEGLMDPINAGEDDQLSENVLSTRFTAALHGITPHSGQVRLRMSWTSYATRTPEGTIAVERNVHDILNPGSGPQANGVHHSKAALPNGVHKPAKPAAGGVKGKAGKPAGSGKVTNAIDPAQQMREQQLAEEAQVRQRVCDLRDRLDRGSRALCGMVSGHPLFAAEHLNEIAPLVTPLLASPVVGDGSAFDAVVALAGCMPRGLADGKVAIAAALRLVELSNLGSQGQISPEQQPITQTVHDLAETVSNKKSIPGPSYGFVFPVLRAVMTLPKRSSLHDEALGVIALHAMPGPKFPREESLAMLYHVLAIIPSYRARVEQLLERLCSGLLDEELPAALQGLLAGSAQVRASALAALHAVPCLAAGACPTSSDSVVLLAMARCDVSEPNAVQAHIIWEQSGCEMTPEYVLATLKYLGHQHSDVRLACADALAIGLLEFPETVPATVSALLEKYSVTAPSSLRSGVALALKACCNELEPEHVQRCLEFMLAQGLADADAQIWEQMVSAGVAIVDAHGDEMASSLLPLVEKHLERTAQANDARYDQVREGAVILLGSIGGHLHVGDPKVKTIIERLLEVLNTPSASVQSSVSSCMPSLLPKVKGDQQYVKDLIQRLLDRCLKGEKYAHRRGAAYGLSGVVKGTGISAINGFGVLSKLKDGMQSKEETHREGALFAVEIMSKMLGRLFEPYIVKIIPDLLERFGDSSAAVREATEAASRAIMSKVSGQGVKLLLSPLLEGTKDKAWRTKQGSIQMLGAMAFCAPRQLSTCLPTIIPVISAILADPHPKVQASAKRALDQIGSVIQNPEVQQLVPQLMQAITNPAKHAKDTLNVLLNTTFINTVDAASLALITPVISRGLRDRSGDTKKRAGRIVGNLCTLINDPKDMAPYVPSLLSDLRASLVDPLPEVRATAAKALGSLLRGVGDQLFADLMPWLLATLKSEGAAVERSGAAQGLAEVLAVMGAAHLSTLLPEMLENTASKNVFVREGHLTLFKFLPLAMPEVFQEHLSRSLPAILGGLADEAEGVREAALAAGRTLVELYAETALPLLLPAVEDGIVNANWRIRQSSAELLGDLLFKVAGISGKVRIEGEDEEGIYTEAQGKAIIEALGLERRNEVLARVYMGRSDVAYSVRNAALHVWKTLVTNTPKTLAELLPTLMSQTITSLADPGEDRQQTAGRCLGELVRKMGERVLFQIVPILQKGMQSEDSETRQGVCYGLKEILENISRTQLMAYLSQLLPTVQNALCDSDAGVRQAAGSAFGVLFKGGAGSAVDNIIPSLLVSLEGGPQQAAQALEGLRVILSVRPQALGVIVPKLLRPPLNSTSVAAIGSLSEVAGASMHNYLVHIMPPLLTLASKAEAAGPVVAAAKKAVSKISSAVTEEGVYLLIAELDKGLEEPTRRLAAAEATTQFCKTTKLDFQEHVGTLITALVPLLAEEEPAQVQACWTALAAVTVTIQRDLQASYVRTACEAVSTAREKVRRRRKPGPQLVPGFCLPRALEPLLPLYLQGVLQGTSADLKEVAAEGLGELVEGTSEEALKPFVIQMAGPLIRVVGDRFPWQVKAAILRTLGLLVARSGPNLKPLVAPLQATFMKALADPAPALRAAAAENLGNLAPMVLRIDQLVNQLLAGARSCEPHLREAQYSAIQGVLRSGGAKISAGVMSSIGAALQEFLPNAGESTTELETLASACGLYAHHCSPEEFGHLMRTGVLCQPAATWPPRASQALTLAGIAQHVGDRLGESEYLAAAIDTNLKLARDREPRVKMAACKCTGRLVLAETGSQLPAGSSLPALLPALIAFVSPDQDSELQRLGLQVLRSIAATNLEILRPHLPDLVAPICHFLADTTGPTKVAAQRTVVRLLQLNEGQDEAQQFLASGKAGATARQVLTEPTLRTLGKMPLEAEDANWS